MIPFCNGFYLFPLSRAVNSNSLIFDPSEVKIGLYLPLFGLCMTMPLTRKVPDVAKEQIYVDVISR